LKKFLAIGCLVGCLFVSYSKARGHESELKEEDCESSSARRVLLDDMSPDLIEDSSHFGSPRTSIPIEATPLIEVTPLIEDSSHFGSPGTSIGFTVASG
jgi:hypothetical protein